MRILLAEDDVAFARTMQHLLVEEGHDVALTHDGNEAWDEFQKNHQRVIISDWMMPGMNGLKFCQRIREAGERDYTYFVLLTANVGLDRYETAMSAGVDDFLSKPVDAQELFIRLHVAERILSSTQRIQHLETLLPICSYCKRIKNNDKSWSSLELYLSENMETDVSHGICPDCMSQFVDPQINSRRE